MKFLFSTGIVKEDFAATFSTVKSSTINSPCGKIFDNKKVVLFFSCFGKKRTKRSRHKGR